MMNMIDANTAKRGAVYYLGLVELVESRLAVSFRYPYVVRGLQAAWQWVEGHDISGAALADLVWDENDDGIAPSMSIDRNEALFPVWRCVIMAVCYASLAASLSEGKATNEIREDVNGVDSQANQDQFSEDFLTMVPLQGLFEFYEAALNATASGNITRSSVRDCAFEALHEAGVTIDA